jgi:hypothetical protein
LDDSIDLLALSDSTIIVGGPDPLVMSDQRLADVGRDVRAEIRRMIAAGAGFSNADVLALKRQLRAREAEVRNKPGGFWVAQDDPAAADHATTATQGRSVDGTPLALLSDGLERAVKPYKLYPTHHALLEALTADGILTCIRAVRAVEADDDQGIRYPRSSWSDDASAIVSTVHRSQ